MKVDFKKINENAVIPERATEFAGGWDVVATEIEKISPNFVICKLGFALVLPIGYKLTLVPRSSLTKTNWVLQNSPGLGDFDFFGEYQLRFRGIPIPSTYNDGTYSDFVYEEFPFEVGDRVGQVYLEEVIPIEFNIIDTLPESNRDANGFGTTGN